MPGHHPSWLRRRPENGCKTQGLTPYLGTTLPLRISVWIDIVANLVSHALSNTTRSADKLSPRLRGALRGVERLSTTSGVRIGGLKQWVRAAAVYTTCAPSGILDSLGFPIKLGLGRFSGAVVVYIFPALKGTQNIYTTTARSCFCSRNMLVRWRSISEFQARWWCIYFPRLRARKIYTPTPCVAVFAPGRF